MRLNSPILIVIFLFHCKMASITSLLYYGDNPIENYLEDYCKFATRKDVLYEIENLIIPKVNITDVKLLKSNLPPKLHQFLLSINCNHVYFPQFTTQNLTDCLPKTRAFHEKNVQILFDFTRIGLLFKVDFD